MEIINNLKTTKQWDIWQIELKGSSKGNPFINAYVKGKFTHKDITINIEGFYDGNGIYKLRFMPDTQGKWVYRIITSEESKPIEGSFECTKPSKKNHGPVNVANKFHFAHKDGTRFIPIGTTCYAWTHQPEKLRKETIETLEGSSFNKLRMCVFPKHYDYNHNEPEFLPYIKDEKGNFDFSRFNPEYFKLLENCIIELKDIGIEADLILFHPYDRWGFSNMGKAMDDLYVRYISNRLSAFSNIWWSLANEYDIMTSAKTKQESDWERFAKIIQENDPYEHLISIHNCFGFYDHTKDWITHCSIQRQDAYKTAEYTDEWREKYQKPVVVDECGYEGDINHGWGNIPGSELVRRFWEGAVRGGYVGHGETYLNDEEVLWWSKGGKLVGQSPSRIRFLKDILLSGPEQGINPIDFGLNNWDLPCGGVIGEYYLFYFGFNQPKFRIFNMPEEFNFEVDVIDTWNMKIDKMEGVFSGKFRIDLPGKQYIAVRMIRI